MTRRGSRRSLLAAPTVVLAVALVLSGCSGGDAPSAGSSPSASSSRGAPSSDAPSSAAREPAPPSPSATVEPAVTDADRGAGLTSDVVPESGPGTTTVVPGSTAGSGRGQRVRVRVEVEDGLPVDGEAFAAFVMDTLTDARGWSREGWDFVRTDADADVVLLLASPVTSAQRCAPLETLGELSCRNGQAVVLTLRRWSLGADAYGEDRTRYRQYLVSHEVGHFIGKDHVGCPGPGEPSPTMLQQSKGVGDCAAQPWPYPGGPVTSTG